MTTQEQEISLGTALGMLFDAMVKETGKYGIVSRQPSETGSVWIGWKEHSHDKETKIIEAPIKLPLWPSRVNETIEVIVKLAKEVP